MRECNLNTYSGKRLDEQIDRSRLSDWLADWLTLDSYTLRYLISCNIPKKKKKKINKKKTIRKTINDINVINELWNIKVIRLTGFTNIGGNRIDDAAE